MLTLEGSMDMKLGNWPRGLHTKTRTRGIHARIVLAKKFCPCGTGHWSDFRLTMGAYEMSFKLFFPSTDRSQCWHRNGPSRNFCRLFSCVLLECADRGISIEKVCIHVRHEHVHGHS